MSFSSLLLFLLIEAVFLVFFTQLMHFRFSFPRIFQWVVRFFPAFCFGVLFVSSWLGFFVFLTGNLAISALVGGAILLLLGYVDYLCGTQREMPMTPRDMAMAVNISQLAHMISPIIMIGVFVMIALVVALCVGLTLIFPLIYWTLSQRLISLVVSSLLLFLFITSAKPRNPWRIVMKVCGVDYAKYEWNCFQGYSDYGFLLTFFHRIFAPFMAQPSKNTPETSQEIVQRYHCDAPTKKSMEKPHIIFIMSESFSDPTHLSGLTFSKDPLPFMRQLQKEVPSGSIFAPGYGGGTAHCECEALTGLSTALCGENSPYENVIAYREQFPSLPQRLKAQGYHTLALHPYNDTMYARPKAYQALGFDEFITQDKMKHTEKIDNCPYISDHSAYREVLDHLEQAEQPSFIHLVTMQNHGGYPVGRFQNQIEVSGVSSKVASMIETYSQGLSYTDTATRLFLEELSQKEYPVLVLFWGDHLPFGYPESFYQNHENSPYQTPFFLWKNKTQTHRDFGILSPFYLPSLIYDEMSLPACPFDTLLHSLSQELRGIHMNTWINEKGEFIPPNWNTPPHVLHDYQIAQYNLLAQQKNTLWIPNSFYGVDFS